MGGSSSEITNRIAEWVARLDPSELPIAVRERARAQLVSVAAAILAGARRPQHDALVRAARAWGAGDQATILPHGGRAPITTAAYMNAAASIALDYDDYLFAGHTGHSAVIASLAFAEACDRSGAELLTAQVAANEVAGRLGAAMLLGPHNGQMWTYIHALAGACIAGRFLGLDAERITHAIGIALAQPPYPLAPAFFGPDAKLTMAAEPLAAGIRAAQLAAEGLSGAADAIGGEGGMLDKIASRALPFVFGGLGDVWLTQSLAYKVVPGCAYVDTPVEAMQDVLRAFADKHGRALQPGDVAAIHIEATLFTDGMERMSAPHRKAAALRAADVNFSAALSIGVLIARGELSARVLHDDELRAHRDAIETVAARTTVVATDEMNARLGGLGDIGIDALRLFDPSYEPSLEGADFGRYTMRFPARATLRTTAGEEHRAEVDIPAGAPGRPFSESLDAVRLKFLREGEGVLGDPAEALALLERLDGAVSVRTAVQTIFRAIA
ncbi:MAG: MmgE/PrpD family protein [Actinomycetota bacterium]